MPPLTDVIAELQHPPAVSGKPRLTEETTLRRRPRDSQLVYRARYVPPQLESSAVIEVTFLRKARPATTEAQGVAKYCAEVATAAYELPGFQLVAFHQLSDGTLDRIVLPGR
jgi:hypothetical protein